MKLTRIFALLLCFTFMAGLLTACDEGGNEEIEIKTVSSENVEKMTGSDEDENNEIIDTSSGSNDPESDDDTWLVMLYQDADDETLEKDIFIDLNEAETVGSTENVTIVSQMDRLDGGYDGDGDWTTTKRFYVTQDESGDLEKITSEEIEDLGEMDMGDSSTLVDFATWAIQNYPASHYVLILSDHGMGWLGGWSDDDPNESSEMSLDQISEALGSIIDQTGIDRFEVVGFDACLMGQLEVFSALAPFARYAVASEETEPALGWAYSSFLEALAENPSMGGDDLAKTIVDSYIDQDGRITSDESRMEFLNEDLGIEEDLSIEDTAAEMGLDITLSAVDLAGIPNLNSALNDLALTMQGLDQQEIARIRMYAQSFTSVFGKDDEPSFIDLGHFTSLLESEIDDPEVSWAVNTVRDALADAVLAERHGPDRSGSTGFSIYFPNSDLYEQTIFDDSWVHYMSYANRFAAASLWDDYLTFHYTDQPFDSSAADLSVLEPSNSEIDLQAIAASSAPETDLEVKSPGAGEIQIAPVELSEETISTGDNVTMSTTISGSNIGYIYYYVSYFNEEDSSFLTADMGYITSENIKEIEGVYYPDWGDDEEIPIEIDWEPTVYFLSDGNSDDDQFAFFEPQIFGRESKEDVYVVYGIYRSAATGEEREAMIEFDGNGKMRHAYAFTSTDEGDLSAPREIHFRSGDHFTIWEEWLELNEDTEEWEYEYYEGGTMIYNDKPFTMEAYNAYSGSYQVGFVVTDLDGNVTEALAGLEVNE